MTPAIPALLHQALAAQKRGNLAEAEARYRDVLADDPGEFNANHLLGVLRFQQGRNAEALALITRALATNSNGAEAHAHCGLVLQALGRNTEALASLERALAIRPDHAEALNSRGMVLRAMQRPDDALASLDAALAIEPNYAEALNNRGILLRDQGRGQEALASFDKALGAGPGNLEIQFNRGLTLRDLGRCPEAAVAFQAILDIRPDHGAVLNNLGLVLFECDRVEEAMDLFRRHAELAYGEAGADSPGDEPVVEHKMRHDREQQDYLAQAGVGQASFRLGAGARLPTPAIRSGIDASDVGARWQTARPQVVVIDDLLTQGALDGLRRFCRESTIWRKAYAGGYLGAIPEYGFACPLLAQIADGLRKSCDAIFDTHHLRYLWAFKCDSRLSGVNIHADFAAVNVNLWITSDEANLDPQRGGLIVWDVAAPLDWDFAKYNNNDAAIRNFLAENGARSVTIPYRANRVVIFDSDLFHETDGFTFKDGYTNRRMNITLLYGRRRSHEGLPATSSTGRNI
jgi:tetratricopeptide (TPR) repeat protein